MLASPPAPKQTPPSPQPTTISSESSLSPTLSTRSLDWVDEENIAAAARRRDFDLEEELEMRERFEAKHGEGVDVAGVPNRLNCAC